MPAATAVLLTGKSPRPRPGAAAGRCPGGPADRLPDRESRDQQHTAADQSQRATPTHRRFGRIDGHQAVGIGRLWAGVGAASAQDVAQRPTATR